MKERGDNRAVNLRWATPSQQRSNQGAYKRKRSGKPILIRNVEWEEWKWFPSRFAAQVELGVHCLHHVADGKRETARGVWFAKWAEADESQDDLKEMGGKPGEIWVDALDLPGIRVSNRGRAVIKHSRSDRWGNRFTPASIAGFPYATISRKLFHAVVFESFGNVLSPGETIDHIDQNKNNNELSNLSAATREEQETNKKRKLSEDRNNSLKNAVEGRPLDGDTWERFGSQKEAARELTKRTGVVFSDASIGMVVRGRGSNGSDFTQTKGWIFRVARA
tara:strand:- start:92 stop:925 length:834 start_codon:yes stop_codon:yes gene_type:complete